MSISDFPARNSRDAKALLMNIARDHADDAEDCIVIIRTKNDQSKTFATTINAAFLCVASVVLQELAISAVSGDVE